jgi:ABC-2 type transport system ATP-binding protein
VSIAIQIQGLVQRYGEVTAVDGLDLTVQAGECFGLLGPNGAGKTTTCEILEGLITPTAGNVEVLGLRWDRDEDALRARIGVALQETRLADKLTVAETLALFRSFYAHGQSVEALLEAMQLTDKRGSWVTKLSGGQRQRLAVACALAGDPDLLFLDEPTTGLDPQSRRSLWDVVSAFKQRGKTVLLTTHYMDEAERLCDRVAVVDHGKVIAEGTPRALIHSLGGAHVVELATVPPLEPSRVADLPSVKGVRAQQQGLLLAVDEPHVALPAILDRVRADGVTLTQLTTRNATLEDVFVSLTGRHLRDA